MAIAWQLLGSPLPTVVLHFGLHCVEHVIRRHWNQLSDQQKHFLKVRSLEVLSLGTYLSGVKLLRESMAKVISEIAQREWPQRWESLTSELINLGSSDELHRHLCVLVLRNIAEVVTAYDPALPDKRRKAIQIGITAVQTNEILPFCSNVLDAHVSRYMTQNNDQDLSLILDTISLIEAFTEYTPFSSLCECQLIQGLAGMLHTQVFCAPVLRVIVQAVNKKTQGIEEKYHPVLVNLWITSIEVTRMVLQTEVSQPLFLYVPYNTRTKTS